MYLADTHCHLDFHAFDEDREAVLDRARENGIDRIMNPGIDLETSRAALSLAERYTNVYAAVGVHPNDALTWNEETRDQLRLLARHPKVVAIGEIGLDYYRDRAPKDLQRKILADQLDLAAELALPVSVHSRNAVADILEILTDWRRTLEPDHRDLYQHPGVLHSFDGSEADLQEAISVGFMIGISGPVTFQNAPQRREVLAAAPLSSLVLETDAPFLTPQPYRGQRNEPAYVRYMAETLANIHHQSVSDVAEITTQNASRLFAWSF